MTCEFKISLPLKKQGTTLCGKPAFYLWRACAPDPVPMCKEHGEACAGNLAHELEIVK